MSVIKIAIVDDHKIVRDGIKAILIGNKKIKLAFESDSGAHLLETLKTNSPDVIILDLTLPDTQGIDLISPILHTYPGIKILILTASMDEEVICEAVKLGALGFLNKDTSSDELLQAIELVSSGEPYFGQKISNIIYKSYSEKLKETTNPHLKHQVSERETEVITLLSEGFSFKEIADRLFISPRTVENHKNNILQKLGLKNTIELLRYAIKNKIVEI